MAAASRHRSRLAIALAGASLAAVAAVPATGAAGGLMPPPEACNGLGDDAARSPGAQERTMRCLINEVRARAGRSAVRPSRVLARAARAKNRAMIRCRVFSHTPCGQTFGTIIRANGYRGRSMGENIAYGNGEYATPRSILRGWLDSPGHRRNMLRADWAEQGVDLRPGLHFQGYSGIALWTSHFGRA